MAGLRNVNKFKRSMWGRRISFVQNTNFTTDAFFTSSSTRRGNWCARITEKNHTRPESSGGGHSWAKRAENESSSARVTSHNSVTYSQRADKRCYCCDDRRFLRCCCFSFSETHNGFHVIQAARFGGSLAFSLLSIARHTRLHMLSLHAIDNEMKKTMKKRNSFTHLEDSKQVSSI